MGGSRKHAVEEKTMTKKKLTSETGARGLSGVAYGITWVIGGDLPIELDHLCGVGNLHSAQGE